MLAIHCATAFGQLRGVLSWRSPPYLTGPGKDLEGPLPNPLKFDMVLVTCPCGHETRLSSRVHTIDAEGVVSPSYVCPVLECTFHEFIRLDGWRHK